MHILCDFDCACNVLIDIAIAIDIDAYGRGRHMRSIMHDIQPCMDDRYHAVLVHVAIAPSLFEFGATETTQT
jgi:hypothetical protein